MKRQTSVDWLAEQIFNQISKHKYGENALRIFNPTSEHNNKLNEILQTARQMHREEVEEAYLEGAYDMYFNDRKDEKTYYTQTFETP